MRKVKEIIGRLVNYAEEHPGAVKALIGAVGVILGVQISPQVNAIIDAVINLLGVLF